jgi:hypothetical protein
VILTVEGEQTDALAGRVERLLHDPRLADGHDFVGGAMHQQDRDADVLRAAVAMRR